MRYINDIFYPRVKSLRNSFYANCHNLSWILCIRMYSNKKTYIKSTMVLVSFSVAVTTLSFISGLTFVVIYLPKDKTDFIIISMMKKNVMLNCNTDSLFANIRCDMLAWIESFTCKELHRNKGGYHRRQIWSFLMCSHVSLILHLISHGDVEKIPRI